MRKSFFRTGRVHNFFNVLFVPVRVHPSLYVIRSVWRTAKINGIRPSRPLIHKPILEMISRGRHSRPWLLSTRLVFSVDSTASLPFELLAHFSTMYAKALMHRNKHSMKRTCSIHVHAWKCTLLHARAVWLYFSYVSNVSLPLWILKQSMEQLEKAYSYAIIYSHGIWQGRLLWTSTHRTPILGRLLPTTLDTRTQGFLVH